MFTNAVRVAKGIQVWAMASGSSLFVPIALTLTLTVVSVKSDVPFLPLVLAPVFMALMMVSVLISDSTSGHAALWLSAGIRRRELLQGYFLWGVCVGLVVTLYAIVVHVVEGLIVGDARLGLLVGMGVVGMLAVVVIIGWNMFSTLCLPRKTGALMAVALVGLIWGFTFATLGDLGQMVATVTNWAIWGVRHPWMAGGLVVGMSVVLCVAFIQVIGAIYSRREITQD
ncbi:MAG: ABC-2 transporter permease [Actinomycetaceae bacterium]|nr:ABC-2 transporter permease [Actinomycetaceae bacterium]